MCDVEDGTANKEGVEMAMELYCHFFEKRQAPPYELSLLIVTIFRKYLRGEKSNRTLEAAFGFTGKQGRARNNNQRNLDIATSIARLHVLKYKKLDYCLDMAKHEWGLGRTIIEKIWKDFKSDAIRRVKIDKGYFTPKQELRAEKALKKEIQLIREHNKKPS